MIDDKDLTKAILENMRLYSIISPIEFDNYVIMVNNNLPFQIFYFINGKLKSIDYLMESPIEIV